MINWFLRQAKRLLAKKNANSRFLNKKARRILNQRPKLKVQVAKRQKYDVNYIKNTKDRAWFTSNKNPRFTKLPKFVKLTRAEKAKYRRSVRPLKETLQKALQRRMNGYKLGKRQNEALDIFSTLELSTRLDEKSNQRYWYFNFDSSWLINGVYDTFTKLCFLKMTKTFKTYTFFGVPSSKMKDLIAADSAGEFMWSWFGKHYSLNKKRWEKRK